MNEIIKDGEILRLAERVSYQEKGINRAVILENEKMKFVVAAMDGGTRFPTQKTLGTGVLFALEGKAIIGYKGLEFSVNEGESFMFCKGEDHYVRAEQPFKMAVVVQID